MRLTNSQQPEPGALSLSIPLQLPGFAWRISGWIASLRGRLLLLVAAALAPAAVIAVYQADFSYKRERANIFEHLSETARNAASDHEKMFSNAETVLSMLTSQASLFAEPRHCQASFRTTMMVNDMFSNIIRLDKDGNVLCSAIPLDEPITFADAAWFKSLRVATNVVMSKPLPAPMTKAPVIFLAQPLLAADGSFAGGTVISLQLSALEQLPRHTGVPAGAFVRLVDSDGMPLIGNGDHFIPSATVKNAISKQLERFLWREPNGNVMIYALVPILKGEINVLIGAEQADLLTWTRLDLISRLVLPLLMVATALVFVWMGTNYLVIRWVNYMRRLARAYAAGTFALDMSPVRQAPSEFRELVYTFSDMASNIAAREKDLKRAIEQGDVLRKEVHHRVKNNLQIVVGLLNIHTGMAPAQSPAEVLERARSRVNAFAHIHQHLYETEDLGRVHLSRFVRDLCAYAHEAYGGEDQKIELVVEAPDIVLSADATISLALFLLEAQTNVYFYAFPDKNGGHLTISVTQAKNGEIVARVTDDGCGQRPKDGDYAVAQSLMRGFARQLGGTFDTGNQIGRGTFLSLEFAPRLPEATAVILDA